MALTGKDPVTLLQVSQSVTSKEADKERQLALYTSGLPDVPAVSSQQCIRGQNDGVLDNVSRLLDNPFAMELLSCSLINAMK